MYVYLYIHIGIYIYKYIYLYAIKRQIMYPVSFSIQPMTL